MHFVMLTRTLLHSFLHFGFPMLLAAVFFKDWKKVYGILLVTMVVDLDHLWATLFDANRCSIGFHPFHSKWAILIYVGMLFLPRPFYILGLGLLLHMVNR
ncbi:MAG: DUF6122 family protein [Bdellovibrionota bacterium]